MKTTTLSKEKRMSDKEMKEQESKIKKLSPAHHKRILNFINNAGSPLDLVNVPVLPMSADQMADMEPGEAGMQKPMKLLDAKSAQAVFELREREFPLGFTNVSQLISIANINILKLIEWLSDSMFVSWQTLPYTILR